MLRDGIVQISSDVCMAKTVFLNLELIEKMVEPVSWAIQNDSTAFNKVNDKHELNMYLAPCTVTYVI